jgi:predicted phage terminase large subunit-like protein
MSQEILGLAVNDLACFAVATHPNFELAHHTRAIIDKLEAVERGEIKRLMILCPPRHGKSMITSQIFPAWYLGRHPDRFVVCASYSTDLATDFGRATRNLVADPLHTAIFPKCKLSDDSGGQQKFNTTAGGAYFAVGRGSGLTGRGAHLLLLDDLLKDRAEADSETIRKGLHEWYGNVAYTRLMPDAAIVNVQTCWHEDDLAGRQLRDHPDEWDVLRLPAMAEENDALGRESGAALWPERYPLDVLEKIKATIGSAAFVSLYQQRPSAATGNVFLREWWRSYSEPPAEFKRIVLSLDSACKVGEENDFSVATVWGVTQTGFYLLHMWRERVEFPNLKQMIVTLATEWKANAVLVEDAASGQSLIQELKAGTTLPVLPIKPDRDKVSRANAVTPLIECGKVFIPESAPWKDTFLDETSSFPNASHDDIVDSTTQALNYMRVPRQPNLGLFQWYEEELRTMGVDPAKLAA